MIFEREKQENNDYKFERIIEMLNRVDRLSLSNTRMLQGSEQTIGTYASRMIKRLGHDIDINKNKGTTANNQEISQEY